jgi:hypothetical protein
VRCSTLQTVTVALMMLPLAAPLEAAPKRVRFTYERGQGAEHCPDELSLKNAVSARLGYDPFDGTAPRVVAATIVRRGAALLGRVEVHGEDGKPSGSRQISSHENDCTELSSALSLAISIAIDPLSLAPPPPRPAPAPPVPVPRRAPRPAPPCPPAPAPRVVATADSPVRFRASAGAHAAFGVAPAPAAFGLDVDVGIRWRALSVDVGGRDRGTVATSLLFATLAPCGHVSFFSGCALGAFGVVRGEHIEREQRDTVPFVALGARAAAEIPIYSVVGIRVFADVLAPLTRTAVIVLGDEVWRAPVVQGALGAAVQGDFP